jgi:hypothetical protein
MSQTTGAGINSGNPVLNDDQILGLSDNVIFLILIGIIIAILFAGSIGLYYINKQNKATLELLQQSNNSTNPDTNPNNQLTQTNNPTQTPPN